MPTPVKTGKKLGLYDVLLVSWLYCVMMRRELLWLLQPEAAMF